MSNSYFKFKQFVVNQSLSAMKVGTDGVLIGAWCRLEAEAQLQRILDIGTGSGLIALMLAQRTDGFLKQPHIDAIEIDRDSFMQATENFEASPWSGRLRAINSSLQQLWSDSEVSNELLYDHIVSNPPYFNNSLTSPDRARTTARHTGELSFEELAHGVGRLLAADGLFSVIIPSSQEGMVASAMGEVGLCALRVTDVFPRPDKPAKRVMMEFCRRERAELNADKADKPKRTSLIIENDARHDYSDDYKRLTADFYLAF